MENKVGAPVEGENFFGRENELRYAWNQIEKGNNLILPSPRRVGKSSFAKKLIAIAKRKEWRTIEINLEEVHTEISFIKLFIKNLQEESWWEQIKENAEKVIDNILSSFKGSYETGGGKVSLEWQGVKKDIYEKLNQVLDHDRDTLIFMDELSVLLSSMMNDENGKENVEAFLHWMRSLRQKTGSKIRWLFCSSVGVANFTHTYGLSDTINDVPPYQLLHFNKDESKRMLEELAKSSDIDLSEENREAVVDKLVYCIPYFLQIIFQQIDYLHQVEGKKIDKALVDAAYIDLLEKDFFNTWIERIHKQYFANGVYAFQVLKHISQIKEGEKRENLFHQLMGKIQDEDKVEDILSSLLYMLKNDGYLIEENGLYHFRSPLLRDFWYKRFVK